MPVYGYPVSAGCVVAPAAVAASPSQNGWAWSTQAPGAAVAAVASPVQAFRACLPTTSQVTASPGTKYRAISPQLTPRSFSGIAVGAPQQMYTDAPRSPTPTWRAPSPMTQRVYTPSQSRNPSPLQRQLSSRVSPPVQTRSISPVPGHEKVVHVEVQKQPTFTPSTAGVSSSGRMSSQGNAFAPGSASQPSPNQTSPVLSYRSAKNLQDNRFNNAAVISPRIPEPSLRSFNQDTWRALRPAGAATQEHGAQNGYHMSVEGWRDTIRRRMHEKIRAGPEQLRMIFHRYDVDQDGDLSEPEVKRLVIDTLEWAEFFLQEQKQKFLQQATEATNPEEQRQMNVYAILIDRQVSTISQSKVELTDVSRYVRKLDRDLDRKVNVEDFVANGNKVLVDILSSVIGSDFERLSERKVDLPSRERRQRK